ncbi:hypothetical protein [Pedobacter sp.]
MKYSIALLYISAIIFSLQSFAQSTYPIPASQRQVYFFYQKWEITAKSKPKVLIVSSHIYRFNPLSEKSNDSRGMGVSRFETELKLSAYAKAELMEKDEQILGKQDYEQLWPKGVPEIHWATFDGLSSSATGPELYRSFNNTVEHLKAVREKFIREYIDKGYKVFQVDFSRNLKDFPFQSSELERIEKLDPRWIEEYRSGEIRYIARNYYRQSDKKNNSKSSGNSTSEFNQYSFCATEKNKVWDAILKARNARSNEMWTNADNAYKNYNNLCGHLKLNLPLEWRNEIDRGLTTTIVADALVGTAYMLTSTPWSYAYGEFLDAKNKTYYHRFNFGISGAYDDKIASVDLSIMSNLMRIPTRILNYRFEADNGSKWDVTKSNEIDNITLFSISVGPAFTLWPQKNIFLQVIPEANFGANGFGGSNPVKAFTVFPSLNSRLGFRFGPVYISGTYGALWKKFEVDSSWPNATEKGSINGYNVGVVNGNWIADNFDDKKMVIHKYWMLSLGFNFGN